MRNFVAPAVILLIAPLSLFAQTQTAYESVTPRYRVYSEVSESHAGDTARNLESLYALYNSFFHFETDPSAPKLTVRIFSDKKNYDAYLTRVLSGTRDDFIYLHYQDPEKSELVGYVTDPLGYRMSLNHQAMIQFLRAHIPNPPLWMREGFAVFVEKVEYDPATDTSLYRENLTWLDTLKNYVSKDGAARLLPLHKILGIEIEEARDNIDIFYPQAWGMVSFLFNSPDRNHVRILWDAISALGPKATLEENVREVSRKAFSWYEEGRLAAEFLGYIEGRKSFRTLIQDGIDLYAKNELDTAEKTFDEAIGIEDSSFIPYYYKGLIGYSRKNYSLADLYYKTALDKGAQPSLVYYAMGVNAFADKRSEEAKSFLKMAGEMDPSYKEKTEELLKRLRK